MNVFPGDETKVFRGLPVPPGAPIGLYVGAALCLDYGIHDSCD